MPISSVSCSLSGVFFCFGRYQLNSRLKYANCRQEVFTTKERTNNQILMTIVLTNDLKFVIITLKVPYALGSFHSL